MTTNFIDVYLYRMAEGFAIMSASNMEKGFFLSAYDGK